MPEKFFYIRLQKRFAARNTDTVKKSRSLFKEGQNLLCLYPFPFFNVNNKRRIMTKGAAEITSAGKNCAGGVFGIVK